MEYGRQSRGVNVMTRIGRLIVVILSVSTTAAYSQQSKSTSYYCVEEFAGGGRYNVATKGWEGSSFRTNGDNSTFILRMTFIDRANNYNISITPWGSNGPADCRGSDASKTVTSAFGVLICSISPIQVYVVNPFTNRFSTYIQLDISPT